ncbi:MAG: hypothetical protein BWZ08_01345 [candidate division BRC1 bacterium ADurb.BinA292]|nr:MAG: hypothetical protein BWZ08_01345 [candidate division BRC1 bacterium ADurb.BinA292]
MVLNHDRDPHRRIERAEKMENLILARPPPAKKRGECHDGRGPVLFGMARQFRCDFRRGMIHRRDHRNAAGDLFQAENDQLALLLFGEQVAFRSVSQDHEAMHPTLDTEIDQPLLALPVNGIVRFEACRQDRENAVEQSRSLMDEGHANFLRCLGISTWADPLNRDAATEASRKSQPPRAGGQAAAIVRRSAGSTPRRRACWITRGTQCSSGSCAASRPGCRQTARIRPSRAASVVRS